MNGFNGVDSYRKGPRLTHRETPHESIEEILESSRKVREQLLAAVSKLDSYIEQLQAAASHDNGADDKGAVDTGESR